MSFRLAFFHFFRREVTTSPMVDATQVRPWTSALSWVQPCSSASDLAASAISAGRAAGRGRRSGGGGAVGGGPTPADKMMKATEPRAVRDRREVLPEPAAAGAPETDVSPDAHAARPTRRRRCCPTQPTTSGVAAAAARSAADQLRIRRQPQLQRRPTSRPTRSGSTASPPASAPTRPASSTAPPSSNSPACLQTEAKKFVGARVSRDGVGRAARALRRLLHRPAWPRSGCPTRRRIWSTSR